VMYLPARAPIASVSVPSGFTLQMSGTDSGST
jgi:hypothetical protein